LESRVINYDIVAITETWITHDMTDGELRLEGFDLFRMDRVSRKGGGVALYIRAGWQVERQDNLSGKYEEALWCLVKTPEANLLVGVCYRSPSSSDLNNDHLLQMVKRAREFIDRQNTKTHLLLMGDFNYPQIDFDKLEVETSSDSPAYKFLDQVQEMYLIQHVSQTTRSRAGINPSLLDLIFTDEENLLGDINYEVPLGKSDHLCLSWKITIKKPENATNNCKRNFWKGNYASLNEELASTIWEDLLILNSVEKMWEAFRSRLHQLVDKHVPWYRGDKDIKKKKKLSKETIRQIKSRNEAWNDYRIAGTEDKYRRYKIIRNKANQMIRCDHESEVNKLLKSFKGKPKKFYAYARKLQTIKTQVGQLKRIDGSETQSDKETAEELCEAFKEVFVKEDVRDESYKNNPPKLTTGPSHNFPEISFSEADILNNLLKLDPSKSSGPDNLHPMVLKQCAHNLTKPLSWIFQRSLNTGMVPTDWKRANICPIYKKGSKREAGNYRPVSLTSVVCKLMETLIKESLIIFVEQNKIISNCQHGFLKGKSCLTNLLESFEIWTRAVDEGYGLDIIYLDYKKAFDTVPHHRLIFKLKQYGIPNSLLQWLENFLTARKMRVGVNGEYSDWTDIFSGVPQGSIIAPLLFLLFVNDLPQWITNSMRVFADDTKIWRIIKSPEDAMSLQNDLDNLAIWSQNWLLRLNASKCKVMQVHHKFQTQYFIEEEGKLIPIDTVKEERDLGIMVTDDLKSSSQCSAAAAKASSILGIVRRNFKNLSAENFRILYTTYVRPCLEYCIQVWNPCLEKDIFKLEQIQRRATKLIRGSKKKTYEQRLQLCGLTTLQQRRKRGDLIETFKILTGKEGVNSNDFFQMAEVNRNLRGHSLKLFKQRSRTSLRQHVFSARVVDEWNSLPQHVVESKSINQFKNRLDRHWHNMGIIKL
jgi:hypothetical protein